MKVSVAVPAFGWILARFSSGARSTIPRNRTSEQRRRAAELPFEASAGWVGDYSAKRSCLRPTAQR
jgi:hypothetical protein